MLHALHICNPRRHGTGMHHALKVLQAELKFIQQLAVSQVGQVAGRQLKGYARRVDRALVVRARLLQWIAVDTTVGQCSVRGQKTDVPVHNVSMWVWSAVDARAVACLLPEMGLRGQARAYTLHITHTVYY